MYKEFWAWNIGQFISKLLVYILKKKLNYFDFPTPEPDCSLPVEFWCFKVVKIQSNFPELLASASLTCLHYS